MHVSSATSRSIAEMLLSILRRQNRDRMSLSPATTLAICPHGDIGTYSLSFWYVCSPMQSYVHGTREQLADHR